MSALLYNETISQDIIDTALEYFGFTKINLCKYWSQNICLEVPLITLRTKT